MNILAFNPGSNTLRYKLVCVNANGERVLREGSIDQVKGEATAEAAAKAVGDCRLLGIDALGFRVVHGGEQYAQATLITPDLIDYVRRLSSFAPLHVPTDLAVIEAVRRVAREIPAVAVFDTGFHRTLPEIVRRYALPESVGSLVFRHGFHGIAHQFVASELNRLIPTGRQFISIHLGGGASACAIRDGQSVDTSMGLTPLEGLVMSTRCGDVDPGVVLALVRQGQSADEIEELLYRQSGLLGLSGRSGDIRDLEPAAANGDQRAESALETFAYRVRKYIGAYAAILGGVDALALSGALAEHSPSLRARVLRGLEFLGIVVDESRNRAGGPESAARLSPDGGAVHIWLIPADEERKIAREVFACLK